MVWGLIMLTLFPALLAELGIALLRPRMPRVKRGGQSENPTGITWDGRGLTYH